MPGFRLGLHVTRNRFHEFHLTCNELRQSCAETNTRDYYEIRINLYVIVLHPWNTCILVGAYSLTMG